jgi:hypothetical protein
MNGEQGFHLSEHKYTDKIKKKLITDKGEKNPANEEH